jgi:hypothetical protein
MTERVLPDFEKSVSVDFANLSNIDRYRIANYLAQSFEKGYYAGRFDEAKEWFRQQDEEMNDKES